MKLQAFHKAILITFLLCILALVQPQAHAGVKDILLGNGNEESILPPDEAFKLDLTAKDSQSLEAIFIVAPGHYLYRDRIRFEIKNPAGTRIESIALPKGELKKDPNFGETEVYHHDLTVPIKLVPGSIGTITVAASYQGCSEKGLCYAPIRKTYKITLPETSLPAQVSTSSMAKATSQLSEHDQVASLLKSGKLWLIIAGFFGFGLLLAFTPCVFPMIPILSSIIVGQNNHPTRLHAFYLSVAYTLGMASAYTLAGIAAGLSGTLVSNALQTPAALGFGALMFVLLALSMFGFYELKLPASFETRMVNASNRIKGGHFLGVFIMGALSALIVSPCVAAPLAGALLYISQTQDVVLGGTALFAMSIGMGVPLLMVGASAGTLLPKTGPWMNTVRNFFGILMLGMAVYLISPLIPVALQMGLWAALLIIPAIFMHALDGLPPHANAWMKFAKGVAVIALVFGITLLIGALSGAKSVLKPLNGVMASANAECSTGLGFQRVKNLADLENHIQAASGKIVMLDFYADWCVACKEFEEYTFSDSRVQKALRNAVLLQADVTGNTEEDSALLKRFGLYGPPGIIFFDTSGREIKELAVVGFQDADKFLQTLNKLPH